MSKKNVISQGNYVGLTIILEQVGQEDLIYRHELMYQITLQYISCDRTSYWDNKLKADITDSFNVKTENWLYENPSEAMAKFQQIRNQVRGLGEFRNLNKGKIPDYRDPPS